MFCAVTADRHALPLPREHWPFSDQGADSTRGEPVQYAKELRGQPQSKKLLLALPIDKRLPCFWRDQVLLETAETRCQMAGHAVFFREGEQASPIHGTEEASKPLTIERWRSALEQCGPFVPTRCGAGLMRRG